MKKMGKKIIIVFCIVALVVASVFSLQCVRFHSSLNAIAKSELKLAPSTRLSYSIEAILNGEPSYIALYGICEDLADQIHRTMGYCITYAENYNRMFFSEKLKSKATVLSSEDIYLCKKTSEKLTDAFVLLSEVAIAYESKIVDANTLDNQIWLERVLTKAKQFDAMIAEGTLPSSAQTKEDVVAYLVFVRDLSNFAEEFQTTIQSR